MQKKKKEENKDNKAIEFKPNDPYLLLKDWKDTGDLTAINRYKEYEPLKSQVFVDATYREPFNFLKMTQEEKVKWQKDQQSAAQKSKYKIVKDVMDPLAEIYQAIKNCEKKWAEDDKKIIDAFIER